MAYLAGAFYARLGVKRRTVTDRRRRTKPRWENSDASTLSRHHLQCCTHR
ncbi:hypothetical protein VFPFJ_02176 [Purpureocillium lilacinum]|uniref:Uncharacterized protein n=1 Tax=Purpureocillium lilacinum TaxID=33203 RepID=A0A179GP14_PURLI|nr:hypothetical protein VFPFJ_02176 [Purpureocillium lilacinum]OAQ79228.1 hypothetical protein VFPBJ_07349 [Purpureocillium lilacinum]OAQ93015.1 hypothetical protein VFPFJ_02176 [Purpureocillium lilacinum]